MPPKVKYSREDILDAAYELVRSKGEGALSARTLASYLGCSTAPIFTAFPSVDALRFAVAMKAKDYYNHYLQQGLSQDIPFKGAGMQYIRFAKEEPELFKLLFMGSEAKETHYMPTGDDNEPDVRECVENYYEMKTDKAKYIYNHMSVYAHGFATLFAQGNCTFSESYVSRMMSEMFFALKQRVEGMENEG